MQTLRRIIVAAMLLISVAAASSAQDKMGAMEKSLFERLGGTPALTAVVEEFVGRAAADARINQKFARTDIPRLKFYLVEQLCAATGGPCSYTGRDMKTTHKNMKVTEGEFNALVEDLVGALDKFSVPEKEKGELLGILGPLKTQIVEVNGDATGAPLPADYKNAPPLKADKLKAGPTMKMKKKKTGM
jgi:hemoglobin